MGSGLPPATVLCRPYASFVLLSRPTSPIITGVIDELRAHATHAAQRAPSTARLTTTARRATPSKSCGATVPYYHGCACCATLGAECY
eukprot:gene10350-biopygen7433